MEQCKCLFLYKSHKLQRIFLNIKLTQVFLYEFTITIFKEFLSGCLIAQVSKDIFLNTCLHKFRRISFWILACTSFKGFLFEFFAHTIFYVFLYTSTTIFNGFLFDYLIEKVSKDFFWMIAQNLKDFSLNLLPSQVSKDLFLNLLTNTIFKGLLFELFAGTVFKGFFFLLRAQVSNYFVLSFTSTRFKGFHFESFSCTCFIEFSFLKFASCFKVFIWLSWHTSFNWELFRIA